MLRRGMKIIAHRGASHEAPENTVASIHLAWQERADGAEVDVRLSLDERVVVIHDDTTQRTTGQHLIVADQTWETLRSLDAGSWKSPRWKHASIPLLREMLKVLPSGRRLFVEIKCGREILPALAIDMDVVRPAPESVCFVGFNADLMRAAKVALPAYEAYLNVEAKGARGAPAEWTAEALVRQARQCGLDGLSVGCCDAVDEAFVRAVLDAKLDLAVWTVDDEHVALRLQRAGLPSLMTNKPAFIRHRLKEHAER